MSQRNARNQREDSAFSVYWVVGFPCDPRFYLEALSDPVERVKSPGSTPRLGLTHFYPPGLFNLSSTARGSAVACCLAFFAAFADPRRRASLRSLRSRQFFDMPVTAPKYTA
jgi:hypothetical protein